MRLFVCALVAAVMAGLPSAAAADPLRDSFRQVVADPTNTEANLRYARLAEAAGQHRLAFMAYERILANDPGNAEARAGLQRTRVAVLPNITLFAAEFGPVWESNPRQEPGNSRSEWQGHVSLGMRDERSLPGMRWRTLAGAVGIYHPNEHDLTYGYAGLNTGPVFDLARDFTMHTAIGGGASYFDGRLFYGEGVASVTFEANVPGGLHALRIRGAYRDYNDFFPSHQGFYADLSGRFVFPSFESSYLIVSPWLRWSDMSGTAQSPLTLIEVQPGSYTEWGGKVEYNMPIFQGVVFGVSGAAFQRYYRSDLASDGSSKRVDTLLIPGALLWFPHLLGFQSGLRIEYNYVANDSNFDPRRYIDHTVSARVVTQF